MMPADAHRLYIYDLASQAHHSWCFTDVCTCLHNKMAVPREPYFSPVAWETLRRIPEGTIWKAD